MSRHFNEIINSTAYESHIFSELEPDQKIVRGNGKRHRELPGWAEKNKAMDELKKTMTAKQWAENMAFDALTDEEKTQQQEPFLKRHGL